VLAAAGGCAVLGGGRLDFPQGYHMVMGATDLRALQEPQGILVIEREDGAVRYDLPVDRGPAPFVIPLPPGRYRVQRLRVTDSGPMSRDQMTYELPGTFEVSAPAVYVGTLRLERDRFATVHLVVIDDFDRTVSRLRAQYPEIPAGVTRALVRPGA
jgi:hypothetical protein